MLVFKTHVRSAERVTGASVTAGAASITVSSGVGSGFGAGVAVGFADNTCAPCAVYAAYNAIPVKDKKIVHGIGMTHSCFGKFYNELGNWQKEK